MPHRSTVHTTSMQMSKAKLIQMKTESIIFDMGLTPAFKDSKVWLIPP